MEKPTRDKIQNSIRFAHWPTRMSSGRWIWLSYYHETKIMIDGGWYDYQYYTIRRAK